MSKYKVYFEDISVEAVFNKLGGVEGAKRLLRDELSVSESSLKVNAIINKLGGIDRALRFLDDELVLSESTRMWREKDRVIYFDVTSDGRTKEQWHTCLNLGLDDKLEFIRAPFKPTSGKTTKIAVLKGIMFDYWVNSEKIKNKADKHNLECVDLETSCLIRDKFSDTQIEEMGLFGIQVMREYCLGEWSNSWGYALAVRPAGMLA